jgi:rubrerythrin
MKILIEVLGGCITNIVSTDDVSIFIVDHDNIKEKGNIETAKQCYHADTVTGEWDSDDNDNTPLFDKHLDDIIEEYQEDMEVTPTRYACRNCGQPLIKSDNPEYTFQCLDCDEDFYKFEAVEVDV